MKDTFLKLMFNILKIYMNIIMIYHFLPERMKIEKVEKLVANLHDKTEYFIHITTLKQELNNGLVFYKVYNDKVHKVQNALLEYLYKHKSKKKAEKIFFKLMNNANFEEKTMKNVRKHRDIKLITTERRINYLVSEQNFHNTKFFTGNLLAIEMNKTEYLWIKLSI